jgi:hypothetical protein
MIARASASGFHAGVLLEAHDQKKTGTVLKVFHWDQASTKQLIGRWSAIARSKVCSAVVRLHTDQRYEKCSRW